MENADVLIIGGGTPPVGVLLYIAQDIAKISFSQMVRDMLPYYIPLFLAVIIIAVVAVLDIHIERKAAIAPSWNSRPPQFRGSHRPPYPVSST